MPTDIVSFQELAKFPYPVIFIFTGFTGINRNIVPVPEINIILNYGLGGGCTVFVKSIDRFLLKGRS
jgi:hypothetical protein